MNLHKNKLRFSNMPNSPCTGRPKVKLTRRFVEQTEPLKISPL